METFGMLLYNDSMCWWRIDFDKDWVRFTPIKSNTVKFSVPNTQWTKTKKLLAYSV